MLAALFFLAAIAAAVPVSRRLWKDAGADAPGPFERIAGAAIVALALVVAIDWALAFTRLFYRGALVGAAVLLLAGAAAARIAQGRGEPLPPASPTARGDRTLALVAVSPLGAWLAYVFWRGTVLFVYLSDGLSYHLPKALFLVRHHAFDIVASNDPRLSTFPANYEVLLADVIALTGRDTLTFAVSLAAYVLFGLVVAAMAERWWGGGVLHVAAAVLVVLAMSPLLLASGAHKNDVLTAATMLAAIHFSSRWAVTAERSSFLLGIVGAALAIGTKVSAGVLLLALVPCVVRRARATAKGEGSWRVARGAVATSVAAFLVLGGGVYVQNLVKLGRPVGANASMGSYGAWDHLWKFPLLAFLRGFSSTNDVWVPWLGVRWSWDQYDLFFAPYGTPTSLLLLVLPWAVWKYRGEAGQARREERALASIAVLISFVATLPLRGNEPPVGFFVGHARYTLWLPVIIVLWTVAPIVRQLSASGARRLLAAAAVLATSASFVYDATRSLLHDHAARLDFVLAVLGGNVRQRAVNSNPPRAGQVVDEHADPNAVVAFEGAFDSWVYPIFGADLSRHVVFLHSDGGPVIIPANVTWVAIDRWWSCAFGSPLFTDFSQWRYLYRGKPLPEDLVVYDQLLADPRFQLVYRAERTNQAVFVRVAP